MKIKYISWLPAAILMLLIFGFSSKPADNSNESSLAIANSILTVYENSTNQQLQTDTRSQLLENINHFVRKAAHFSEYALLACAFALNLLSYRRSKIFLVTGSVLLSAIYAASDEFHQTFIPGRSGQISDVLLDTAGALAGAVFFVIILGLVNRFSKIRKKEFNS